MKILILIPRYISTTATSDENVLLHFTRLITRSRSDTNSNTNTYTNTNNYYDRIFYTYI